MDHFSEQALIDEVRAGSRVAFDELMRRHQRLVYRVAYAYTRNPDDAMDVTQDVFLKVVVKLPTYRGTGPFKSWLLRVAHRETLNWWRQNRRFRGSEELTMDNAPSTPPVQESTLLERRRRDQLLDALAKLNPRQRQAITLRYYEQLPVRDIAAVLDCSPGVAKNILFRGVNALRQRLAVRWRDDHERVPSP